MNGWSAVEVWYLGLDHVDKELWPVAILGGHFPDGFIALLRGGRSSQSKDKYNSLFIVCCVSCIHVIMLLELSIYTYIYIALPASMTVHNVFHISLLKKCIRYPNHVIY